MCVVVPDKLRKVNFLSDIERGKGVAKNFIYHRIDLSDDIRYCSFVNRLASLDGPSVTFTASAYTNPLEYLGEHEITPNNVLRYKLFMEGADVHNVMGLKEGVRSIVAMTEPIQEVWKNSSKYYKDSIIWRYVGLATGVFLMYPAHGQDDKYDHTKRPWYLKAIAFPDQTVLSAPYQDASSENIVITISKTVVEGRPGGASVDDVVIGVMGLDLKLAALKLLLDEAFPVCLSMNYSCFLVDFSGFLVYHDDFLDGSSDIEYVHLIRKEPEIAQSLIKDGVLSRETCDNFESKDTFHTWQMLMERGIYSHMESAPIFKAEWVPGSNFFIFLKMKQRINFPMCHCPDVARVIDKCKHVDSSACECPCKTLTPFRYCQNTFSTSQDNAPICVPIASPDRFISPIPNEKEMVKNLSLCYNINCTTLDKRICQSVASCSWCTSLSQPFCSRKEQCPIITTISTPPETTTVHPSNITKTQPKGGQLEITVGAAVGGVVFVFICNIVAVVLWRKCRRQQPPIEHHTLNFNPSSQSSPRSSHTGSRFEHPTRIEPDLHSNISRHHIENIYLTPNPHGRVHQQQQNYNEID